jgi:hypothetical protein
VSLPSPELIAEAVLRKVAADGPIQNYRICSFVESILPTLRHGDGAVRRVDYALRKLRLAGKIEKCRDATGQACWQLKAAHPAPAEKQP